MRRRRRVSAAQRRTVDFDPKAVSRWSQRLDHQRPWLLVGRLPRGKLNFRQPTLAETEQAAMQSKSQKCSGSFFQKRTASFAQ